MAKKKKIKVPKNRNPFVEDLHNGRFKAGTIEPKSDLPRKAKHKKKL